MNGDAGSEAVGQVTRLAVACTFCSKSIGHRNLPTRPLTSPATSTATTATSASPPVQSPQPSSSGAAGGKKTGKEGGDGGTSCSCRKPRSRCALCMSRLNTTSSLTLFAQRRRPPPKFPFDSFTVFCATCRHSGHALHYLDWFRDHINCPVAGCTCTCSSLDARLTLTDHSHHSG